MIFIILAFLSMNICAKTKVIYINGDQTDLDTWIVNLDVFRKKMNTTTIDLSSIDKDGITGDIAQLTKEGGYVSTDSVVEEGVIIV